MRTLLMAALLGLISTDAFAKHCCYKAGGSSGLGVLACNADPMTFWTDADCGSAPSGGSSKHCCLKIGGPSDITNVALCNANPNTLWTSADCGYPPASPSGYCCLKQGGTPIGDFQTKARCESGPLSINRRWMEKPCNQYTLAE